MSDAGALKVQFQYDFGSANACLSARVIPDTERRTATKFDYVPVLHGPKRRRGS
jgi:hypothetical protein